MSYERRMQHGSCMGMRHTKEGTVNEIKKRIGTVVGVASLLGYVSVEALEAELARRREEPAGYHNT